MPFCSSCGSEYQEGAKFCSSCGQNIEGTPAVAPALTSQEEEAVVWEGKPSGLKGKALEKANANTTTYVLTNHRLILKTGLVGKKEDQIDLTRIKDVRVSQGMKERAMGVGRVEIISSDSTSPKMVMEEIQNPKEVKDILWGAVRKEKIERGATLLE